MQRYLLAIGLLLLFSLTSCGGQGGSSSSSGFTPVTISLGGTSVAGGAVAPAGTNPTSLGIVLMSVEARNVANTAVAGPVTANAANNFTASLSVPNGNGITFTVRAFDGVNTKVYQGITAAQNLTGTAVTIPVTMKIWLGGVAAAGAPLVGSSLTVTDATTPTPQTITLTTDANGQYQGSIPQNFMFPLLLNVNRSGLPSIYSMMTRTGRVNTTPLTTIATAQSLAATNSTAIRTQFSQTAASIGNAALDNTIQAAANGLMQRLGLTAFTKLGTKNPLTDPSFAADGTGLDAVMDSLDLKERDEDGDGTVDLVLANRSPQATSVMSVKSQTPNIITREPYSFAIPAAAVAGDDIYGTPIGSNEVVVITKGSTPSTIALGAGVGAGLSTQDLNKLVGALVASAEESGINVSDSQNSTALGSFVGQTIQSIKTANSATGGTLSATIIQQAASATKMVMTQAGNTGGVFAPTFNPTAASQQTSAAATNAIQDNIAPIITTPVDRYIEATGMQTPYALSPPAVFDSSPPITLTNNALANYHMGTTVVTWTATDAYGNSATAIQRVVVQDTTSPTITLTGMDPYTVEVGQSYTDAGATAYDLVDGYVTVTTVNPVITTAPATFIVAYNVSDIYGNAATQVTRTVQVVDTTAPVINGTPLPTITLEATGITTPHSFTAPLAVDNYAVVSVTANNMGPFNIGTTIVTWTATDNQGLTRTASQNITVQDTTAPTMTLNGGNMTIPLGSSFVDPGVTITDAASSPLTATVTGSVNTSVAGTYALNYSVSDASGNAATAVSRTVVVAAGLTAPNPTSS